MSKARSSSREDSHTDILIAPQTSPSTATRLEITLGAISTQQSDDVVRDEIVRAERAIVRVSGQSPRPRFRAPYGMRDERILKIASNLGYRSIYWTIDSLDGVEPAKSSQFLIDRITSKSDAELEGAIILMHVGVRSTADALPSIIANLQGRGFHLVTISKLLESAPKTE